MKSITLHSNRVLVIEGRLMNPFSTGGIVTKKSTRTEMD